MFAIDFTGPNRSHTAALIREVDTEAPELLEIARANDNIAEVVLPEPESDYQRALALRSGAYNAQAAIARSEAVRRDHVNLFKNWDDGAPQSKAAARVGYDYKSVIGDQIISRLNEPGADVFYSAKKNKYGIRLNYSADDKKNEFLAAAAALTVRDGKISIAAVMRELHVGDKRAKEIVQKLYDFGFVGEYDHKLKGRAHKGQTAAPVANVADRKASDVWKPSPDIEIVSIGTKSGAIHGECTFREMPRTAPPVEAPVTWRKSAALAAAAAIAIIGAGLTWGIDHYGPSPAAVTNQVVAKADSAQSQPRATASVSLQTLKAEGQVDSKILASEAAPVIAPKFNDYAGGIHASIDADASPAGGMIIITRVPPKNQNAITNLAIGGGIGMAGMERAWAFAPAVKADFASVCQSPTPIVNEEQVRFEVENGPAFLDERAKALSLQHVENLNNQQVMKAVAAKNVIGQMASIAFGGVPNRTVPADVANVVAKDLPDACKRFIQNLKAVAAYEPSTPNCEDGPIYKGKNPYILHCLANFSAMGYEMRNGALVRMRGPDVAMGKSFKDATKSVVMAAVRKAASPLRRIVSLRLQKAFG